MAAAKKVKVTVRDPNYTPPSRPLPFNRAAAVVALRKLRIPARKKRASAAAAAAALSPLSTATAPTPKPAEPKTKK